MKHRARHAPWRDTNWRSAIVQALVLLVLAALGVWLIGNVAGARSRRHVASGFAFLGHTAGFGIAQTLIDYTEESSYGRAMWVGLANTLLVSGIAIVLSTIIGFIVGIGRLSTNWLVAKLCTAYVEALRNMPLLLQILFWYFGVWRRCRARESITRGAASRSTIAAVPAAAAERRRIVDRGRRRPRAILMRLSLGPDPPAAHRPPPHDVVGDPAAALGLPTVALVATDVPFTVSWPTLEGFNYTGGLQMIPELAALAMALSVYTAAYIAEIVRAGLLSVARGQREAAQALGLKHSLSLRLILVPQALRVIIPPLASEYLSLTKNSTLAIVIGYPDLVSVFAGTVLNQTGQAIEILSIVMAIYLTLSLVTSLLMNLYNRAHAMEEAR